MIYIHIYTLRRLLSVPITVFCSLAKNGASCSVHLPYTTASKTDVFDGVLDLVQRDGSMESKRAVHLMTVPKKESGKKFQRSARVD